MKIQEKGDNLTADHRLEILIYIKDPIRKWGMKTRAGVLQTGIIARGEGRRNKKVGQILKFQIVINK